MLSTVAAISGLYDVIVGAFLLVRPDLLASLFGVPPANPRIFSDLNALFLLAVGVGYALPWREPDRYRAYMWVMGPGLKGAGRGGVPARLLPARLAPVVPAVRGERRRAGAPHPRRAAADAGEDPRGVIFSAPTRALGLAPRS